MMIIGFFRSDLKAFPNLQSPEDVMQSLSDDDKKFFSWSGPKIKLQTFSDQKIVHFFGLDRKIKYSKNLELIRAMICRLALGSPKS